MLFHTAKCGRADRARLNARGRSRALLRLWNPALPNSYHWRDVSPSCAAQHGRGAPDTISFFDESSSEYRSACAATLNSKHTRAIPGRDRTRCHGGRHSQHDSHCVLRQLLARLAAAACPSARGLGSVHMGCPGGVYSRSIAVLPRSYWRAAAPHLSNTPHTRFESSRPMPAEAAMWLCAKCRR